MNTSLVESALTRLGDVFEYHRDVEVLLVGGAAGMLTGLFPQPAIPLTAMSWSMRHRE